MKHSCGFRLLAAAALLLALLLALIPGGAAAASETEYIVKYNSAAARLMGDGAPFDVVSEAEMRRLRGLGLLEWYEPDGEAVLLDADSDYYSEIQWNLDLIGAVTAFTRGSVGQGIRVGVLDSGVNPHPDLDGCLQPGRNYIENADPNDTADNYGHGTRVAGLVAASGPEGYIGVAPGAEIVPLKITDSRSVKISAVCRAIYSGIDDFGCRVLNLSLGVQTQYESLREAAAYAEARGVVLVSAVGNGGTAAVYYPAAYDTVIGVGAVDRTGSVYARSNHNGSVLLTAPGVEVRCPAGQGGYTTGTGTSFAVPQVSGAAAVLLSVDPSLDPARIRQLLSLTASDRGAEGFDEYYGYGILDLTAALEALGGSAAPADPCSFLPETGPADALRNDTDEEISCTCLLARYDADGVCQSVSAEDFTLPPRGTAELSALDESGDFSQFVYETGSMVPLTAERRPRRDGDASVPAAPAFPAEAAAGFYDVGQAAGVTVQPAGADGPAAPVSKNVDDVQGVESFYPGTDRLRITLPDTEYGAQYVLTVSVPQTGTVLFADQRTGGSSLVFDAAFCLPAQRTELLVSIGSNAADFAKITVPLSYTPGPAEALCLRDAACLLTAFSDLDAGAWYHDGIHYALREGLMNGTGADMFSPNTATSRAMLVTVLWRLEGSPAADAALTFGDVQPDQWYTEAICWAASKGIVTGYSPESFGPDDDVRREQLAAILWRFARYRGADTDAADSLGQYIDAEKISPWALEAMRWAVDTGLVRGVGADTLSPRSNATRAQTATMLQRFAALLP